MSVLFPKVNKPPTWDYRPIYYDPKKEEMKEKLAALQARRAAEQAAKGQTDGASEDNKPSEEAVRVHSLHRGSFREAHDAGASRYRLREERKTKMRVWLIILAMLIFFVYLLGLF